LKNSTKNVALTSVDVLFTTEEEREETKWEKVQNIPLSELHPFRDHPFNVVDDDKMQEMVDSIREYGVLVPIIARPTVTNIMKSHIGQIMISKNLFETSCDVIRTIEVSVRPDKDISAFLI
jgi:hypothetical protein